MTTTERIKKHIKHGNKKLDRGTMIFNVGAGTDCPSRKLGLCQCAAKCYATRDERTYKACLPYRRRQRDIFNRCKAETLAAGFMAARTRNTNTFRFNESGDFRNQSAVDKMTAVCRILTAAGLTCYGYTARTDLDLSGLLATAGLNVSNDGNGWQGHGANRFKVVKESTGRNPVCAGAGCGSACTLCQRGKGMTIEVIEH